EPRAPVTYPTAIKNITAGKLVRALRRDGFVPRRAHGSLIFIHPDGRMVPVHYHHSGQVFPPGTLRQMLAQARWTPDDLKRLKLIPKGDP
ncbi:MAG: type II toxin-antitoxin system HicA family toxin, partial [Candidatus Bipolaricaulota bacterium]|nr:type II toxin-antitoxin system HicA family toxin [Candidatus Bipolaricaulota bacterium]